MSQNFLIGVTKVKIRIMVLQEKIYARKNLSSYESVFREKTMFS